MERPLLRRTLVAAILTAAVTVCEGSITSGETGNLVLAYQRDLRTQTADGTDERQRLERLHQLRNADAMVELVSALPLESRPAHILYLAAGSHLAPLALCELLPAGAPCSLVLTEIDGSVSQDVSAILDELSRTKRISGLRLDDEDSWRFGLSGHPVRIDLVLVDGESLIETDLLDEVDLVINHDWSGDPLGNLKVIHDLLLALRSLDDGSPPALLIEDLERHPYPVDLTFFSLEARTSQPYGHRDSARGAGLHGDVELGEPLFGGGVLLDFSDLWWRRVDRKTLDAVFNLMIFNEFDSERQNVLVGGDEPLFAPALLDWYSDFGSRTIAGDDLDASPDTRSEIMIAAAAAMPFMEPGLQRRLACRLQLYHCLLQARAVGAEIRTAMPSVRFSERAAPADFPTETMESMYREALRHAGDYRRHKETERDTAKRTIEALEGTPVLDALTRCPVSEPTPDEDSGAFWLAAYQRLAKDLVVD